MTIKLGINGFGRIGRMIFRTALNNPEIEVTAINDLTDTKTTAHLLEYDSVHGLLNRSVTTDKDCLNIDGKIIKNFSYKDPGQIPWKNANVDIVCECTGLFRDHESASKHFEGGARKVLISAPASNPDITIVMGVNDDMYDPSSHNIISNASCTTNCLAPLAKVLNDEIGIVNGLMTTIHAYTNDQVLTDVLHSDLRRARSATMSQIPTKTGAAAAVGIVLPELNGKLDGFSMRVPTINVSVVDLTFTAKRATTVEEVNAVVKAASEGSMKGVLAYNDAPLVSIDFNHNPHSSIFDAGLTKVMEGTLVKVCSWYDNEWGFSCRMLDTALVLMKA